MDENEQQRYIDEVIGELEVFTPMELMLRDHYRLVHHLDFCDTAEQERRERAYHNYTEKFYNRHGGPYEVLPDTRKPFFRNGPLHIMKQARYIPAQMHCHSFIELFYVVRGECIHVCGDKKYLLRAGDFCFWQFDLPHYIQADSDDCIAVNILIQKPAFRSYFFGMLTENNLFNDYFNKILYGEGDSPMILFRTGDDRRLCALVCAMYREYDKKGDYWKTLLCSYLNYLFVYLLREHQGHLISSQEQGHFDPTLEILEYIQEHYDTITLNELCQKFNYSEAYLSRLIKKKSGKTFTQLVHTQRLYHAAWLLENTDRSVGEIAMEVHYADTSHFCREFTKNYGVSPGNYRKNRQNDSDRDAV